MGAAMVVVVLAKVCLGRKGGARRKRTSGLLRVRVVLEAQLSAAVGLDSSRNSNYSSSCGPHRRPWVLTNASYKRRPCRPSS
ncbi:hypothetical protein BDY21DRAFT_331891 [Lineolata rhizophorae]|uniref:Uncharacterized protein n=1 Tax=Lineolata rhizophorae TaxID=578093 RepID=A0A6A6PC83_9PEZI|nr:hypothetical protein BDY21DRAFT_331891 [Lineolata rhizophorae]